VRKILSGIGRSLITLGLLILLFVGYQLWGTNILEARAQDDLATELDDLQAELAGDGARPTTGEPATTTPTTGGPTTTEAPATTVADEPVVGGPGEVDLSQVPRIGLGDPLGRLQIPQAGVDKIFVVGTGRDELAKGPGWYPATQIPGSPHGLPDAESRGVAAIAGHRTTYGAPFYNLNELRVKGDPESGRDDRRGDVIVTETLVGTHVYEVIAMRVVRPDETWVAAPVDQPVDPSVPQTAHNWNEVIRAQDALWGVEREPVVDDEGEVVLGADGAPMVLDPDKAYLVLTTCNPRYSAAERLVVLAELITDEHDGEQGEGAVTVRVPKGDLGDGGLADLAGGDVAQALEDSLGGDPASLPPALAWGGAAGAVGLLWWWAYRRWRHPITWFAGVAPFLAVLFGCYIYVERLLPAGF
jgi:sortase A